MCVRLHATLAEASGQAAYRLLSELNDFLENRALQGEFHVEAGAVTGEVLAQGRQLDRPGSADWRALIDWLSPRADVADYRVDEPQDAWHSVDRARAHR